MRTLTEWVLRHRLLVGLAWLAVAATGGVFAPTTIDRLSYEFALPGQPAYETNVDINEEFGVGGTNDPLVVVVRGPRAQQGAVAAARAVEQAVEGTRIVTAEEPGAQSLTATDGELSVAILYPLVTPGPEPYAATQPRIERVVAEARENGTDAELTGFLLLAEGGAEGERGVLVEVLFGGVGALVVLALVFGSFLAGVPLLVAAVSILGTFLALLGLTGLTEVSFVVQYLVALIGLGVAID